MPVSPFTARPPARASAPPRRRATATGLPTAAQWPPARTAARRDPALAWMRQTFRLSARLADADAALELVLPAGASHEEIRAAVAADGVRFTFLPRSEP